MKTLRVQKEFGITLDAGDRVVAACPHNGYIVVVTERGYIYTLKGENDV